MRSGQHWVGVSKLIPCLIQTPERLRPTPPREATVRTRAASPRRAEGRYMLPPRVHRSSDPGLAPGTTLPTMLCLRLTVSTTPSHLYLPLAVWAVCTSVVKNVDI